MTVATDGNLPAALDRLYIAVAGLVNPIKDLTDDVVRSAPSLYEQSARRRSRPPDTKPWDASQAYRYRPSGLTPSTSASRSTIPLVLRRRLRSYRRAWRSASYPEAPPTGPRFANSRQLRQGDGMYLHEIFINNNGPLRRLHIEFTFDAETRPIPHLIVGRNGSGKTNLLSLIADAFMESSASTYNDVLPTSGVARHTFASRWLGAGGSEGGLMAAAGWSSREMVDRYSRATASERAMEESRRLGLGDL